MDITVKSNLYAAMAQLIRNVSDIMAFQESDSGIRMPCVVDPHFRQSGFLQNWKHSVSDNRWWHRIGSIAKGETPFTERDPWSESVFLFFPFQCFDGFGQVRSQINSSDCSVFCLLYKNTFVNVPLDGDLTVLKVKIVPLKAQELPDPHSGSEQCQKMRVEDPTFMILCSIQESESALFRQRLYINGSLLLVIESGKRVHLNQFSINGMVKDFW